MIPPGFLVYIWIYSIQLFLTWNKICEVWGTSELDHMKHCVYSGCVLNLLAGAVGRYLRAWVTSAPAPRPSQGPAHRLRQKWFLLEQINRFLAGTDCIQGPVLASIQTNLLRTFQSVCAPIQSWILLLNFEIVMSDFCWGTVGAFCYLMLYKIYFTWSVCR